MIEENNFASSKEAKEQLRSFRFFGKVLMNGLTA